MPLDPLPDDLDTLRALVISLASERDAAIAQCRRVNDENDRLSHLLRQLQRAQFGRRSERLDPDQIELALEDIETAIAENQEERARDAALAMQEYQAEKLAIGVKTAHLRALRLAKEAETSEHIKRKNPRTRIAGLARES